MVICWSDPPTPPAKQVPVASPLQPCRACGSWQKQASLEYCEVCLQKNAMNYIAPSAPPYQQPTQYTYAVPYQQPQMYNYYQARPLQYPPQQQQQQQIGTATALAGGFVLGAVMDDMFDPTE